MKVSGELGAHCNGHLLAIAMTSSVLLRLLLSRSRNNAVRLSRCCRHCHCCCCCCRIGPNDLELIFISLCPCDYIYTYIYICLLLGRAARAHKSDFTNLRPARIAREETYARWTGRPARPHSTWLLTQWALDDNAVGFELGPCCRRRRGADLS